jgi:hypothetical protein
MSGPLPGSEHGEDHGPGANAERRAVSAGLLALIILIVDASVLLWAIWAAGGGVDSGLLWVGIFLAFNLPATCLVVILGVASLVKKSGRMPGAIALVISGGALIVAVYGFVTTQIL